MVASLPQFRNYHKAIQVLHKDVTVKIGSGDSIKIVAASFPIYSSPSMFNITKH
jgi:hypothetical protein